MHCQVKTRQIDLFVTYADNYAIGYFKKQVAPVDSWWSVLNRLLQGFTKCPPNNTDARYAGYIKVPRLSGLRG